MKTYEQAKQIAKKFDYCRPLTLDGNPIYKWNQVGKPPKKVQWDEIDKFFKSGLHQAGILEVKNLPSSIATKIYFGVSDENDPNVQIINPNVEEDTSDLKVQLAHAQRDARDAERKLAELLDAQEAADEGLGDPGDYTADQETATVKAVTAFLEPIIAQVPALADRYFESQEAKREARELEMIRESDPELFNFIMRQRYGYGQTERE